MRYILLLALFCGLLPVTFGQSIEDTISTDVETDSLSWLTYQYTDADDIGMIEDKTPILPTPEKLLVVRYQSSASIFIDFGRVKPSKFSLVDRERKDMPLSYSTAENVVQGLDIDRLYDLVITSEGEPQVVGLISTFS
jgi:hypothetical protein